MMSHVKCGFSFVSQTSKCQAQTSDKPSVKAEEGKATSDTLKDREWGFPDERWHEARFPLDRRTKQNPRIHGGSVSITLRSFHAWWRDQIKLNHLSNVPPLINHQRRYQDARGNFDFNRSNCVSLVLCNDIDSCLLPQTKTNARGNTTI